MPRDKLLHILAGAFASLMMYMLGFNLIIAFSAAVVAGIGKEIYDAFGNGTVDAMDAVATIAGGGIATLLLYIL